jgi:hypothetical protein
MEHAQVDSLGPAGGKYIITTVLDNAELVAGQVGFLFDFPGFGGRSIQGSLHRSNIKEFLF